MSTDNGWIADGEPHCNDVEPGDDAQGSTWTRYYSHPSGWYAEVTYYAVGYPEPLGPPEDHTEWGVDCMTTVGRRDAEGVNDDSAETTEYEHVNYLAIDSLDAAVELARKNAGRDIAWTFGNPRREAS